MKPQEKHSFADRKNIIMIDKSKGKTRTEKLLSTLCDSTFLKLWSYANPCKDDGKELCDLIALFEDHLFIFFDRESLIFETSNKDTLLIWQRWKKKAIEDQIDNLKGAEKYIKSGKPIYLDAKKKTPFPLNVPLERLKIHKIIVAHGAHEACKNFSEDNMSGSLAVSYGELEDNLPFPFCIHLDKNNPIHVFDSCNLEIVLKELDTFYDFISYIKAKETAIKELKGFMYSGEEELLAYYFLHFDEETNLHFIKGKKVTHNGIFIAQGFWGKFIQSEQYRRKKAEDQVSYLWDDLIQRTCQNALDGTLITETDFFKGPSAICEMAKEPRFVRRALSKRMAEAIREFPENGGSFRMISYMPSFYERKACVFLQLYKDKIENYDEYRKVRQGMLEIACGATKNKFTHLNKIIGIAIDAPKHSKQNSEDFVLLDCENWTEEQRQHYEDDNKIMGFYKHSSLRERPIKVREFPDELN